MDGAVGFSSEVSVHSVGEKEREGRGTSQWRESGPESEPPDGQRSPGKETQPQDKETWGGWPQLPLAQVEKLWWVLG